MHRLVSLTIIVVCIVGGGCRKSLTDEHRQVVRQAAEAERILDISVTSTEAAISRQKVKFEAAVAALDELPDTTDVARTKVRGSRVGLCLMMAETHASLAEMRPSVKAVGEYVKAIQELNTARDVFHGSCMALLKDEAVPEPEVDELNLRHPAFAGG